MLQYMGAAGLFGPSFFILFNFPKPSLGLTGLKRLLCLSCVVLLIGTILSIITQASTLNDLPIAQLSALDIESVLTETHWGKILEIRLALEILAIIACLALRDSKSAYISLGIFGGAIQTSFAYTGHGSADGFIHLGGDIIHLIASGAWIGSLYAFCWLLNSRHMDRPTVYRCLSRFSGVGSVLVAALILTGGTNGYFLVFQGSAAPLLQSPYVQLLLIKLILFLGMLGAACLNRFVLAPSLSLSALRYSLYGETSAGLIVLALISIIGITEPP